MNRTWLKKAIVLALFGFILLPNISFAATIRTDKTANIDQSENIDGNIYLLGGQPKILGTTTGDVVVVGNNIESKGNTKGDIISVGNEIYIEGNTLGDVRVFGGDVKVKGVVDGDLIVIAGNVVLEKEAQIKGDIVLIAGKVDINNSIDKHLRIVSGAVNISGEIKNTANITSEKINIFSGSKISGHLNYFSPRQAVVEDDANVSGSVNFNKIESIKENGLVKHAVVSFLNFWMLFRFITTLLLTFILVYVFKIFSQKTSIRSIESFWKSLLIGIISMIFIPAIIIVCLISLILVPVAVLLILIYIGIFIISTSIAGIALGAILKKVFSKNKNIEVSFQSATIGIIVLTLLQFVPVFGDLTRFVFLVAAFGSIWLYLYEKIRWGEKINVLEKN